MSKTYVLLALALGLATQSWAAAQAPAGQRQVKDREEFDLFNSIIDPKLTDPAKRLQLLDQWKQKYPDTAFQDQRWMIYMQTYQQLNQPAKAVEAAKEVLKLDPNNFSAHYTIASLVPFLGSADPKVWADGEKSAHGVLQTLEQQFAADKKPANVSDADWGAAKKASQIIAHQALGWVAKMQKKNDAAETEFINVLELNPTNATVSYWLGESVLAQRNPDKNTLALFSFARAAAYDGQGALPPAGRQQVDAYLTKVYNNYHGADPKGLAELKTLAKASPLPPADLKIKSSAEIAAEKEEELRKSNPLLATFMAIKDGLTGADSGKFWEDMKGKAMPKLRGTVVSITPAAKPKTLGLAMSQSTQAEILLTPETVIPRSLQTGAVIEFEGAEAVEFTPSPFQIKMQDGKITSGLPEPPPATKKAPGKTTKTAKKKAA